MDTKTKEQVTKCLNILIDHGQDIQNYGMKANPIDHYLVGMGCDIKCGVLLIAEDLDIQLTIPTNGS